MQFIIDIDDTILISKKEICSRCGRFQYSDPVQIESEIAAVNLLYKKGHSIILHTGRGWDCYDVTKKQLASFDVMYHELIMGKPVGIYIDKTNNLNSAIDALDLVKE
jgi:hypothetical protein